MRRSIAIAVAMLFVLVPVASAAAPNDTVAGAVTVFDRLDRDPGHDVGRAPTDPLETALNDACGAPVVEHGVWFTIDGTDGFVSFDVNDSDYAAGIMLFEGAPTTNSLFDCGPGRIVDFLASGVTYNVLVFGDGEGPTTAGTMILHVGEAAPPPDVTLTVDPKGSVDKQGAALITGTASCTSIDGSGILLDVFGQVRQRVGRVFITGFFDTFLDLPCDGATIHWEAFVVADENGLFAGGKAATVAIATGCTDFCSDAFVEATVQLPQGPEVAFVAGAPVGARRTLARRRRPRSGRRAAR